MVCALSSTTLIRKPSGRRVPSSCSNVPLGSSSSLLLKSSCSMLLWSSFRSTSERVPPAPPASDMVPLSLSLSLQQACNPKYVFVRPSHATHLAKHKAYAPYCLEESFSELRVYGVL